MIKKCNDLGAASVETCVLLHKKNPKNKKFGYYCDYIGFFIPDHFIVGYGLDYNEQMRDLSNVCKIS